MMENHGMMMSGWMMFACGLLVILLIARWCWGYWRC